MNHLPAPLPDVAHAVSTSAGLAGLLLLAVFVTVLVKRLPRNTGRLEVISVVLPVLVIAYHSILLTAVQFLDSNFTGGATGINLGVESALLVAGFIMSLFLVLTYAKQSNITLMLASGGAATTILMLSGAYLTYIGDGDYTLLRSLGAAASYLIVAATIICDYHRAPVSRPAQATAQN